MVKPFIVYTSSPKAVVSSFSSYDEPHSSISDSKPSSLSDKEEFSFTSDKVESVIPKSIFADLPVSHSPAPPVEELQECDWDESEDDEFRSFISDEKDSFPKPPMPSASKRKKQYPRGGKNRSRSALSNPNNNHHGKDRSLSCKTRSERYSGSKRKSGKPRSGSASLHSPDACQMYYDQPQTPRASSCTERKTVKPDVATFLK
ncbi:hypothetical protein ADUPG1_013079 [Aduncisulcus paluster]|uniref:Uncharacterized protein n=1 Tax=Aduncisulcus paluster TaxID=2918883 RepID=A0ABQ5K6F8_9EUKA|nr:hypothetical protein ADUPG1_013079 [Aduncisulcus paluster]